MTTLNDVTHAVATDTVSLSFVKVVPATASNAAASKDAALARITVLVVVSYGTSTVTHLSAEKAVPWGVRAMMGPLNAPLVYPAGLLIEDTSASSASEIPISVSVDSDPAWNLSFIFRPSRKDFFCGK